MIFDKDSTGAVELKGLLGFIYKSNKFENLISYIGFAERDIKKIIGKEVYKLAEDHYHSENYMVPPPEDPPEGQEQSSPVVEEHPEYALLDDLVHKIQLPIALHAYRRFAPSQDLTHSDKGRQILSSEDEKPAWEWMIERDNQNLLSLAYEATDLLLEFLEEQTDNISEGDPDADPPVDPVANPITVVWATSEAYSKLKNYIITLDKFNEIFPIGGSRRLFIAFYGFIERALKSHVIPVITQDRYDILKEKIMDKELDEDDDDVPDDDDLNAADLELLELIYPVIVFDTMSRALKSLAVEVLPEGIFQNYIGNVISGKNTASRMDRIEVSARFDGETKKAMKDLQEYLRKIAQVEAGGLYVPEDTLARIDKDNKIVRF